MCLYFGQKLFDVLPVLEIIILSKSDVIQSTGTADLLARLLLENLAQGNAFAGLVVVMVSTMMLTDFMNNTATAAVMAPIGLGTALRLGVNPDTLPRSSAPAASGSATTGAWGCRWTFSSFP